MPLPVDNAKLRNCEEARKGMMKDGLAPGVSYNIIKFTWIRSSRFSFRTYYVSGR